MSMSREDVDDLLDSLFKALSHRYRRRIIELCMKGDVHPDDLAREFGVSRQTVEGHLTDLEQLGLIERIFGEDGRVYLRTTELGKTLYPKLKKVVLSHALGEEAEAVRGKSTAAKLFLERFRGEDLPAAAALLAFLIGFAGFVYGVFSSLVIGGVLWLIAWSLAAAAIYISAKLLLGVKKKVWE